MSSNNEIVIVLPVYEDRDCLRRLLRHIAELRMPFVRLLIVDDGSVCEPPKPDDLTDAGLAGEIVRLSRNAGHQIAIAIALLHIQGRLTGRPVLVMDADGEDRADAIPELIARFKAGDVEVVAARRAHRTECRSFRVFYTVYKALFRVLTGRAMTFGNFALLSADAVRSLAKMPSLPIHFAASVIASGLPIALVPVDRGHRYAGASRMRFFSLSMHAVRALAVFLGTIARRVIFTVGIAIAIYLIAITALCVEQSCALQSGSHSALAAMAIIFVALGLSAVMASELVRAIKRDAGHMAHRLARAASSGAALDDGQKAP